MRSVYLDTELMLAIHSPQLNAQIRGQIQVLKEQSRRMAPDGSITDGPRLSALEQGLGKQLHLRSSTGGHPALPASAVTAPYPMINAGARHL